MIGVFFDWLRHRARSRRWSPDLALGRRGEDLAHRYLRRKGFKIVARNYRLGSGDAEADVIGWDGEELVFVEVKSRTTDEFGSPLRSVDQEKRTALLRAARHYARRAGVPWERVRFDLLSVVFSEPPAISHLPDAFAPIQTL